MKKHIFILSLLFLSAFSVQGQNKSATFLSSQPLEATFFVGFDGLANLFYIENNVLYKKNHSQLWQYKNLSLGKITKIDLQNPLKIVLFYEDFNSVILLDNQLNEIQKINFYNENSPIIASAIGIASQNRLWLFDAISQKIALYDYSNGTMKYITPALQSTPKYYESDFNTFQWIDENLNWFSCDVYGNSTALGKAPSFDKIQIINNQILLFSRGERLYFQDFKTNKIVEVENVDKSFENFMLKDQILSIFTNRQIKNYKIKIP